MKRLQSKKSHSWWWDSHISPKNSRWLSENLEQMDLLVKEMLKLIEEDGDSFAKKAEMYYKRRPELIKHVEDFYRMYRALAERYDNVTGELRKNIRSELRSQGSGSGSDLGVEPASPFSSPSPIQTPKRKQNHPKEKQGAVGYDFFLRSEASFDFSHKGSDDSSSSSDSSSDSEDGKVEDVHECCSELNAHIIELENELREAREKLQEHEKHLNDQLCLVGNKDDTETDVSNEAIAGEAVLHPASDNRVAELEAVLSIVNGEISHLKEAMETASKQYETDISFKDQKIEEYKIQLDAAHEKFMQDKFSIETVFTTCIADLKIVIKQLVEEKSLLETRICEQEQMVKDLKDMVAQTSEKLAQEKSLLEAQVSSMLNSENLHSVKLRTLEERVKELEAENAQVCNENSKRIAELNNCLDGFKLKVDTLTSEKDELHAQVTKLADDAKSRDDNSRNMAEHMHQLHLEHMRLIREIDDARKASVELRNRMRELEEEVDRQRTQILDSAEGKREAIRQLCFSLEHYRDGYKHLKLVLQGMHKRSAIMAI
ncbi:hypothetical protein HPP92_024692 [Vanilla planifolia]|uniref:NAB domain-containing protein n=1 Tax=Vanilla planifolia TaxID=51239 RepID=A0A835PIN9_VANPL|nr:hypothetical protein HPP92_024692 [Vanilla planifolia]